jgi:hypothetical protein
MQPWVSDALKMQNKVKAEQIFDPPDKKIV